MRRLVYFIVGFVIWILGTWPFYQGRADVQVLVAGLIVSALVAFLFHELLPKEHHVFMSPVRIFWLIVYAPVFFFYVLIANLDVVYRAVHPQMPIRPGIVKIKTGLKTDSGITALANSITLTPGTLAVDLERAEDGAYLYIHWINVRAEETEEATRLIGERFEWFLKRIFE
jgi:multicomponent Na+:H+ antiporter subunit E